MMTQTLGTLEELSDLRTIWPHEALDFTPWLSQNLQLLSDAIGVDIELSERESAVGAFQVDICGYETSTDRRVIIENQLEDTNHDHLGKLITYAAGKSADIVIWLVKRARDEHKAAVEWLNAHTDDSVSFFLCEIKLYRIGDSAPAVKFELIEAPNAWLKESGSSAALSPGGQSRFAYWSAFIDYAFADTIFAGEFGRRKPTNYRYLSFYIGEGDAHVNITQVKSRGTVDVAMVIKENKDMFSYFMEHKDKMEEELGFGLIWDASPDKKTNTARIENSVHFAEQDEWHSDFDWVIETAVKMKHVFKRYIAMFEEAVDSTDESLYDAEK